MLTLQHKDFIDPKLQCYYRFITKQTILLQEHTHDFWEFSLLLDGEISQNLNGKQDTITDKSIILIKPTDVHILIPEINSDFTLLNFSFTDDLMRHICQFLSFDYTTFLTINSINFDLSDNNRQQLLKRISYINTIDPENKNLLAHQLKITALDTISLLIQSLNWLTPSGNIPHWFKTLLNEINNSEILEEGLPAMNRLSKFSHGHLNRLFKKYVGTSTVKYLTNLRLNYAANLLTNSDLDILNISVLIGYSSLSHFNHIFKEKYGVPPSVYREINKSIKIT